MLPEFPYSQAIVTVSGSAYYYEFGKFLADLENHFPYMRVQNLNLEPGFGSNRGRKEKLSFRMEIVTPRQTRRPSNRHPAMKSSRLFSILSATAALTVLCLGLLPIRARRQSRHHAPAQGGNQRARRAPTPPRWNAHPAVRF